MTTIAARSDYRIGRDNIRFLGLDVHNPVFVVSSLTIIAFVTGVLTFRDAAAGVFDALYAWLTSTFDWVFMGAGNLFVLFCLLLLATPVGRVRLGGPDARPDYSAWSWFAMLFAAGIGIGLMFFGVAEPVDHFRNPPLGVDAADTAAAHRLAIASAIYHWGVHPWAMFAVVALALAFAAYNLGLPLTLRSAFYPVMGDAVWGRFGHVIDILAVFAALFGLATSLGLGAEQTAAGLSYLFGVPDTDTTRVLVIAGITSIALASVVAGLDKGVKRLSQANLVLALLLLVFVLAMGPTVDLLTGFVASIGHYLVAIGPLSNWAGRDDFDFLHGWTTFFWAWWLSWSPFVGMFIARVSRGRTVRQLVGCMLVVPVSLSALWMHVFGATALSHYLDGGHTAAVDAVRAGQPELALFRMLELLPLTGVTSTIGVVLVIVFFVTSSDSGSLVIDTITAGGKLDAPVAQRVFWCTFEGLVAITLLVSGGLVALQTASLLTGFPFALVLLGMCCSIWKGLRAAA
ncbi:MAG: BCCT family transporter [Acidobacteria bacterium]|nr:BCCT family transporter [Acidobacteriota bacterium]MYH27438.1 BCCT family transporter [Acidobacteriota bacterium]